jgi:subtilisin family serine protease
MSRRGTLALAVCVSLVLLPTMAFGELVASADQARPAGGAPTDRVLLVTFADRPDRAAAQSRLSGLGPVRPSVPEIGVWEVHSGGPPSVRGRALTRDRVVRAEWSRPRTVDALTDPRPPPPATLPPVKLPEPTDPFYAQPSPNQQWGLHLGNWMPGLSAYDRPTIAILDSGIDSTHEEWRASGVLVSPRSTVRHVDSAEDIGERGHGTHVAGIAAAPANGVGIVGVAPASASPAIPGVSKVMSVQIADTLGQSTDATMIRGIRWAVNHGAKVINISSGGKGYAQAFQDTVNWAFRQGALIVASVGNEGLEDNPLNYPAGYDHVIGVGAQCDAVVEFIDCPTAFGRARFSNSNYSVDLLAPGVNIPSTIPLAVSEGEFAAGYGFKSGTSMAAPYVAGVAALVFASHPGISPYQVTRILQTTASRGAIGRNSTEGWGIVNALGAAQAPAPVDDLGEMNDDVKWLPKSQTLRATRTPVRLSARADFNDDPIDAYPVLLRKGERLKVTIAGNAGRLGLSVFRPSSPSVSPSVLSDRQFDAKLLGAAKRSTPGTRTVVVRARESGRHFVTVYALARGGDYILKVQRL